MLLLIRHFVPGVNKQVRKESLYVFTRRKCNHLEILVILLSEYCSVDAWIRLEICGPIPSSWDTVSTAYCNMLRQDSLSLVSPIVFVSPLFQIVEVA